MSKENAYASKSSSNIRTSKPTGGRYQSYNQDKFGDYGGVTNYEVFLMSEEKKSLLAKTKASDQTSPKGSE